MKTLNKLEVFRECGLTHFEGMPSICFKGYDRVMKYCYDLGTNDAYVEAIRNNSEIPELRKKIKDLETANVRLLDAAEYNRKSFESVSKRCKDLESANTKLHQCSQELQVDNENALKEVENQHKIVATLRNENMNALSSIKDVSGYVEELEQENLEYSKRCEELRRSNSEHAKAYVVQKDTIKNLDEEIEYLHGCIKDYRQCNRAKHVLITITGL